MKVAIITAGQPRFTPDFITVLGQLKGFESADLYINLWKSDWADTVEQGMSKIQKILPAHIQLKRLNFAVQPEKDLPSHDPTSDINELKWWYDRRIGQIQCLQMAFDLIQDQYDVVIRLRPDGCLGGDVDISSLDFAVADMYFCQRGMGIDQAAPNDQFFVGTQLGMKFLCDLYYNFDKYMIESCPAWQTDVHSWALEYIIKTYYEKNNKAIHKGHFDYYINRSGRSAYTVDKHTHVHIAPDPTA